MKHKIFEKSYGEYRSNSKMTISKWLKVYLKEKNPWYVNKKGLCFNDELVENKDEKIKIRYNDEDSAQRASIRRGAKEQILTRINYIFEMDFDENVKISKKIWELFISIFIEVNKSTDGKDGIKMLKENKFEIIPQKIRDNIVRLCSDPDGELSKVINKYSTRSVVLKAIAYEWNTEQHVAEEKFSEPIKTRLIQNIETLFFDYRNMCDVKDVITDVCDKKISEMTKKEIKNSTPEQLLKLYTQLPKEEQCDETILWIKKLIHHKNMINNGCYEVDRQIGKICKALEAATKEMNDFLCETASDEDYDTYAKIAVKRMIDKSF